MTRIIRTCSSTATEPQRKTTAQTPPQSTARRGRRKAEGGMDKGTGRRPRLRPPPLSNMRIPLLSLLPLLLPLLLLLLLPSAHAYPAYLLEPEGCKEKKLEVGFPLMGSASVADRRKRSPIRVYRGDTPLPNGAEYVSGESLSVKLEGLSGQFCLEVVGDALFTDGGCGGKRTTDEQVLGLPIGGNKQLRDVELKAGVADAFGPVAIVKPFLLRAPGTTPPGQAPSIEAEAAAEEDEEGPASTRHADLVLGSEVPRLNRTVLLDKKSGMELSWTVDDERRFVDIQVAGKGQTWVSVGVINGPTQMVAKPAHRTLLYPDPKGGVSLLELKAKDANGITMGEFDADEIEVLMTQSTPTFTLLRFRQHAPPFYSSSTTDSLPPAAGEPPSSTDNDNDAPPPAPPLAPVAGVGAGGMGGDGDAPLPGKAAADGGDAPPLRPLDGNKLVWAHGEAPWPATHDASDFVHVRWLETEAGVKTAHSSSHGGPLIVPGLILLLLPLLALPLHLLPPSVRTSPYGRFLLQKRLWPSAASYHYHPSASASSVFMTLAKTLTAQIVAWGIGVCDAWGAMRWGAAVVEWVALLLLVGLTAHWYHWQRLLGSDHRRALAVSTGILTITVLMLVTLPAGKVGFWVRWIGLPFDRAISFHRHLGVLAVCAATLHALCSFKNAPLSFSTTNTMPVATAHGLLAWLALSLLAVFAMESVRRKAFELFKGMHYLSAFLVLLFSFLHLPAKIEGLRYYVPTLYFSVPLAVYAADVAFRTYRSYSLPSLSSLLASLSSLSSFLTKRDEKKEEKVVAGAGGGEEGQVRLLRLTPLPGGATKVEAAVPASLLPTGPGQYFFLSLPALPRDERDILPPTSNNIVLPPLSATTTTSSSTSHSSHMPLPSSNASSSYTLPSSSANTTSTSSSSSSSSSGTALLPPAITALPPAVQPCVAATAIAGEGIRRNVPETWHPFSVIGETDGDGGVAFVMKDTGEGTWTRRVRRLAEKLEAEERQRRANASWVTTPLPLLRLDGPYGRLSLTLHDYPRLLLVGGGVGITPLSSTLRWLLDERRAGHLVSLTSVQLLWAVRDAAQLGWFEPLLHECLQQQQPSPPPAINSKGEQEEESKAEHQLASSSSSSPLGVVNGGGGSGQEEEEEGSSKGKGKRGRRRSQRRGRGRQQEAEGEEGEEGEVEVDMFAAAPSPSSSAAANKDAAAAAGGSTALSVAIASTENATAAPSTLTAPNALEMEMKSEEEGGGDKQAAGTTSDGGGVARARVAAAAAVSKARATAQAVAQRVKTAAVVAAGVGKKEEEEGDGEPRTLPFRLHLFVTSEASGGGGVTEGGLVFEGGRPDVGAWVEKEAGEGEGAVGVVVCGPMGMVGGVTDAVVRLQRGGGEVALHEEVFCW